MYDILYTKDAAKSLRKMPRNMRESIENSLRDYAAAPAQGRNVIKLEGRPGYRMRVGDWRILFEMDHGVLTILVLKIAPRGEVYKQ